MDGMPMRLAECLKERAGLNSIAPHETREEQGFEVVLADTLSGFQAGRGDGDRDPSLCSRAMAAASMVLQPAATADEVRCRPAEDRDCDRQIDRGLAAIPAGE